MSAMPTFSLNEIHSSFNLSIQLGLLQKSAMIKLLR